MRVKQLSCVCVCTTAAIHIVGCQQTEFSGRCHLEWQKLPKLPAAPASENQTGLAGALIGAFVETASDTGASYGKITYYNFELAYLESMNHLAELTHYEGFYIADVGDTANCSAN